MFKNVVMGGVWIDFILFFIIYKNYNYILGDKEFFRFVYFDW